MLSQCSKIPLKRRARMMLLHLFSNQAFIWLLGAVIGASGVLGALTNVIVLNCVLLC